MLCLLRISSTHEAIAVYQDQNERILLLPSRELLVLFTSISLLFVVALQPTVIFHERGIFFQNLRLSLMILLARELELLQLARCRIDICVVEHISLGWPLWLGNEVSC